MSFHLFTTINITADKVVVDDKADPIGKLAARKRANLILIGIFGIVLNIALYYLLFESALKAEFELQDWIAIACIVVGFIVTAYCACYNWFKRSL